MSNNSGCGKVGTAGSKFVKFPFKMIGKGWDLTKRVGNSIRNCASDMKTSFSEEWNKGKVVSTAEVVEVEKVETEGAFTGAPDVDAPAAATA